MSRFESILHLDAEDTRFRYLSAEQFMGCCDQIWSTDKRSTRVTDRSQPRHGSVVYVKRDHATQLFASLRGRRARIVVVSAESDMPVEPHLEIPPQVSAWYSTNSWHAKVLSLPLGLGNSYCGLTTKAVALATVGGSPKSGLLYVNFRSATNDNLRRPLWASYERGADEGWVTRKRGDSDPGSYAAELAAHQFVLCPAGNGIDTHRLWETLYAGSIPVVQRHPALVGFDDLPILFVDDLMALDRNFLERAREEMKCRSWNLDKLFLPYWRDRIAASKELTGSPLGVFETLRSRIDPAQA